MLAYTRSQDISTRKFPADPERYWVALVAEGQRPSRLFCLREPWRGALGAHGGRALLGPAPDRLPRAIHRPSRHGVAKPRNWHRRATSAANLPVLEIADRDKIPFPGFDRVLLRFHELQDMVTEHRYADWRAALLEVQGIYLITDSSTGRQYVGKADGGERILGRWFAYSRDGHGGNIALRELATSARARDGAGRTDHARHLVCGSSGPRPHPRRSTQPSPTTRARS